MTTTRQHVAVIGTGMAGLVTAYILRNDPQGRFEVEVFEKVDPNIEAHPCSPKFVLNREANLYP